LVQYGHAADDECNVVESVPDENVRDRCRSIWQQRARAIG
jgi:hypothetical protein